MVVYFVPVTVISVMKGVWVSCFKEAFLGHLDGMCLSECGFVSATW